jgi:hypothetical protein
METELNEERFIIEKRRLKQGVDITLTCEKNALEDDLIFIGGSTFVVAEII